MPALVIAIGNSLRRDDGVAQHVAKLLNRDTALTVRSVLQLTPELAADLAPYNTVIFIDADVHAKQVTIAAVLRTPANPALTHVSRPEEIVALARSLFGFAGEAYTCRIPAFDLSAGADLSLHARRFVRRAARQIEDLLSDVAPHCPKSSAAHRA